MALLAAVFSAVLLARMACGKGRKEERERERKRESGLMSSRVESSRRVEGRMGRRSCERDGRYGGVEGGKN